MKRNSNAKKITASKPSATDKENLVGAGRMLRSSQSSKEVISKSDVPEKTKGDSYICKKVTHKDNSTQTTLGEKIKIKIEDLTSEAGPSENYWEILAERRRIALEDALEENKYLTEGIEKLQEENRVYKEMLNETRTLVEVLQDMIGDDRNDINNSLNDSVI